MIAFRFILTSLSKPFDNLSEIYSKKSKGGESVCDLMELEKNKCILLLRKDVYYKYMDSWERFDEASLPDKKAFYSELNLEDTIDKD